MRVPLALVVSLAAPGTGQTPEGFPAAWNSVATDFEAECTRAGVVGASLAFVHGKEVVARASHGFADLATQRPVDADTIFHWASCTKTLTGIAIMQLRDRGRLRLDDAVVEHLPDLRAVHNPFGAMRAITLAHLLSHSSGFRGATWPWAGKAWHPHEPRDWSQLVAMVPYTEIEFAPGSRYGYSNPGIVFLGRILEQISGEDYETYMEKNVLRPLEMRQSYFDLTPYHLLRHRSNNYQVTKDGPAAGGLDFDTGVTVSNGGLNAPVVDMARYMTFLLGTVSPDSSATAVLARPSLEEMWRPVLPLGTGSSSEDAMGLTFFVMTRHGQRFVGHTGGQKSFVTFFYVHPESATAGLGAFNTNTAGPVMATVRARMMETLTPLFSRR